jgi:DNA processing protein
LITADFALEHGRDVLAVPGSILSPSSVGTNQLLKQGAIPVTCVEDVLESIGSTAATGPTPVRDVLNLQADESVVCRALDDEPRHVDELARSLSMGPGTVSATLAILELKGLARRVGSMLYTRA